MENFILIDWFAVTFRQKGISVHEIIKFLDFKYDTIKFTEFPGRYRYRSRLSFGNIHIYYNGMNEESDFPMLELTGQGCREFETFSNLNLSDFVQIVADNPKDFHICRIDVAYDDHSDVFDIHTVINDEYQRNYISKSSNGRITCDIKGNTDGFSAFFGSKSSDIYMRIYDKAIERGFKDGRHWIRLELVLKQGRAEQFIINPQPLGVKFRGVLSDYIRFVTPNKTDSNKRRWKTKKYWSDFLVEVEPIKLFEKKDIDYNISRLQRYVFHQCGNSVDTYIKCVGFNRFLDELLKRDTKLTAKQRYLIDQCKILIEANEPVTEETIEMLSANYKL